MIQLQPVEHCEPEPSAGPWPVEETLLRSRTWALLGALLARPPEEPLLSVLRGIDAEAGDDRAMAGAWAGLALAARRADPASLDDEYHALFIGVGRGELVPYGSWYLTGLLMEKPLAALRADLARLGIGRGPGVCEPEDHAAALCECMGLLAGDAGVGVQAQQAFFRSHVEPWLGRFFEDLARAPSARFYASVGVLGQQFVELERGWFSLTV